MSLIIPANSAAAGGGFEATNSLMFNRADGAYLVHTNSGTGSYQQSTFSAWVKRSSLGTIQTMWNNQVQAGVNQVRFEFDAADKIYIYGEEGGGYALRALTTSVYRDLSAWYHVLVIIDTPQSAAADRIKLYVNGVQVTLTFSTTPAQNANLRINYDNTPVSVGSTQASNYLDGYMAEVYWIDGTVYATSDFGEFDEDSGIWKPIDASGLTFGTNGFYLDFENSSALGDDAAGSNDFSLNNLAATDQMIDTCTNNFPTLNILESSTVRGANTYSQGNLQVLTPQGESGNTFSTVGVSSGKWYSEFYIKANSGIERSLVGVSGDVGATLSASNNVGSLSDARDVGYMGNDGDKFVSNSESSYGGSAFSIGDVIGVALDLDNNTVNFAQNNSFKGTIAIASTGTWHMGCGDVSGGIAATIVANYGQNSSFAGSITAANETDEHGEGLFKYSPPSGFITLNTKNLAEYG